MSLKKLNRKTAGPQGMQRPVKVLQFGGGNFLRAFADWMIDIANDKTDFNGSVEIVLSIRQGAADVINAQDGLYHVVTNGIAQGKTISDIRLIRSVAGAFNPANDFPRFLRAAENPDLQIIISNTTEAGIAFYADDTQPNSLPESFPGKLTALLYHRFIHFNGAADKGLVILPCELIEKNGATLHQIVLRFADHWSLPQEFKNWIIASNTFCNTLVDRIVPGYPKDKIQNIQQATGYEDDLVVTAEPFYLWAIEGDDSVSKKFPLDQAGLQVKFVSDLAPFRTRKVRILNGGHTTLVPVAYLAGLRTVRESAEDKVVGAFLRQAIYDEIIPTLHGEAGELRQFAEDVLDRFSNPFIRHELASIALNSISKFSVRVLPSLLAYIDTHQQLPRRLTFSLAALIRFYKGTWQGQPLPVHDSTPVTAFFADAWKNTDINIVAARALAHQEFWGKDLTQYAGLTQQVVHDLNHLEQAEQGKVPVVPAFLK
jgi:tagaturonate reductase